MRCLQPSAATTDTRVPTISTPVTAEPMTIPELLLVEDALVLTVSLEGVVEMSSVTAMIEADD